ncbi:uncharacterized protein LOC126907942 isoform X6 [Daktulosphaira vitifoliae]|uniref:uncharacterized protein LOC126907942 isoform X6 n=1 Tax=Daktulosphaira vitifoliae TaxID=58002 RepID=UPI0021AA464E|nr:uncharacterized protein LOC126907942 isoform X6 [Daktulosphaira vitifoliae]
MHCQIYIGLFFCVVSILCKPTFINLALSKVNSAQDSNEKLNNTLKELFMKYEKNCAKERPREVLFKTNNKTSYQELITNKHNVIPEEINQMIEKIFPDSENICSIRNILKNLKAIKDNNTTIITIITKLEQFNENEYISLRIFAHILNDTYVKIPNKMVGLFNKFLMEFRRKDKSKTGKIPVNDFRRTIRNVIKNDDVIEDIAESFKRVEYVYYEAWLLKKRKDIDAIKFPKYYMQLMYKEYI